MPFDETPPDERKDRPGRCDLSFHAGQDVIIAAIQTSMDNIDHLCRKCFLNGMALQQLDATLHLLDQIVDDEQYYHYLSIYREVLDDKEQKRRAKKGPPV